MKSTVLLVDDDLAILNALRRVLEQMEDLDVLTAPSGAKGLAILHETPVDLIISDEQMPGMAGHVFLERASQIQPLAIRIVLTGHTDIDAAIDLINRSGIYRYITKPWNDRDLLLIVENALNHRKILLENQRLQAETQKQNRRLKQLGSILLKRTRIQADEILQRNDELDSANRQLRLQQQAMMQAFCNIMEMANPSMGGHGRRVAQKAREVADVMGMEPALAEECATAALLHDIGKVAGQPPMAGNDPAGSGGHTDGLLMHPIRGQAALLPVESLASIGLLIRAHHERYDGNGHPDAIAGADIPLGARIIAAANMLDHAVGHDAPNGPLSEAQAFEEIRAQEGRMLDPAVLIALGQTLQASGPAAVQKTEARLNLLTVDAGMVLARDLRTIDGLLVAARGMTFDRQLIDGAWRFKRAGRLADDIYVFLEQTPPENRARKAAAQEKRDNDSPPCSAGG